MPIALVAIILFWLYEKVEILTKWILPSSIIYAWWHPIAVFFLLIITLFIAIFLIGLIFSFKPLKFCKRMFDGLLHKIPVFGKIYSFGEKVVDTFISDVKHDKLKVVKVNAFGCKMMGILTDEKNKVAFVPTGPNPTNGFIFVDADYQEVDMTSIEVIEFVTSLGKVNANKIKE